MVPRVETVAHYRMGHATSGKDGFNYATVACGECKSRAATRMCLRDGCGTELCDEARCGAPHFAACQKSLRYAEGER